MLIRLCWCADWSAPLLVAYGISRFSHDEAHIWIDLGQITTVTNSWMVEGTLILFYLKNQWWGHLQEHGHFKLRVNTVLTFFQWYLHVIHHWKELLSLVTRKPVFGIFVQVRLKLACTATEAMLRLESSDIKSRGTCNILSRQRTTKALIRLICVFVVCIWHKQVLSWRSSCFCWTFW